MNDSDTVLSATRTSLSLAVLIDYRVYLHITWYIHAPTRAQMTGPDKLAYGNAISREFTSSMQSWSRTTWYRFRTEGNEKKDANERVESCRSFTKIRRGSLTNRSRSYNLLQKRPVGSPTFLGEEARGRSIGEFAAVGQIAAARN